MRGNYFTEMPRTYVRKSKRGSWTEDQLKNAFKAIKEEGMSVYKASKTFDIPEKTLRRRILKITRIRKDLAEKAYWERKLRKNLLFILKSYRPLPFVQP